MEKAKVPIQVLLLLLVLVSAILVPRKSKAQALPDSTGVNADSLGRQALGYLLESVDWSGARVLARKASGRAPDDFRWLHVLALSFVLESAPDSAKQYQERSIVAMTKKDDLRTVENSIVELKKRYPEFATQLDGLETWTKREFASWRSPQLVVDELIRQGGRFEDRGEHKGAAALYGTAVEVETGGGRPRPEIIGFAQFASVRAANRAGDLHGALARFDSASKYYVGDLANVPNEQSTARQSGTNDIQKGGRLSDGEDNSPSEPQYDRQDEPQKGPQDGPQNNAQNDPLNNPWYGRLLSYSAGALSRLGQDSLSLHRRLQALRIFESNQMGEWLRFEDDNIRKVLRRQTNGDRSASFYAQSVEVYRRLISSEPEYEEEYLYGAIAELLEAAAGARRDVFAWDEALSLYREAFEIYRARGNTDKSTGVAVEIASAMMNVGDYEKAQEFLNRYPEISIETADTNDLFMVNAKLRIEQGKYDDAVEVIDRWQTFATNAKDSLGIAYSQSARGALALTWHHYDTAEAFLVDAYAASLWLADKDLQMDVTNSLGKLAFLNGRYEKAAEYWGESYQLARDHSNSHFMSTTLNNLSNVAMKSDTVLALSYLEESLAIALSRGDRDLQSTILNNMSVLQDDSTATQSLSSAVELAQTAEKSITALHNRSIHFFNSGDRPSARDDLRRAIAVAEEARAAAPLEVKREYLDKSIHLYRRLLSYSIQSEDLELVDSFDLVLSMQARAMEELLRERHFEDDRLLVNPPADPKQLILIYENGLRDTGSVFDLVGLAWDMTNDSLWAVKDGDIYDAELAQQFNSLLGRRAAPTRGVSAGVQSGSSNEELANSVGGQLYDALIRPFEVPLTGKSEIVVVASGPVGLIPFEALVLPDGTYLGEHYSITYAPSILVWSLLHNRTYSATRKPLLAFGGARYDDAEQDTETRALYSRFGYESWSDLPGTVEEVEAIAAIVEGSRIITGQEVSEERIKTMSATGELSDYNVLHFATHGLAVPEVPELSALVLSQDELSVEDGYLQMNEVYDLEIEADFVNLSACETGLGKIYGGEGIVGLTQAFLLAGANGVSVSLWQVADESTGIFMRQMYLLVEEDGLSYSQAVSETKRMFITGMFGEDYRDPYYWAPFVYYGR